MLIMTRPLDEIRHLFTLLMDWHGDQLMPAEFAVVCYASTFLSGCRERTWSDLLGPPSIGKTEIIRVFDDKVEATGQERRTIIRGDFTENAFSSAYRDEDNPDDDKSLLYLLSWDREPRGPKFFCLPELTTILESSKERARRLYSQLRAAFDDMWRQQAGNLGAVAYNLGFGMLTACTEKLDDFRRHNQALGERTVICRIGADLVKYNARFEVALHALQQDPVEKAVLREKLRSLVLETIERIIPILSNPKFSVEQTDEFQTKLAHLGTIATAIRTTPVSDRLYTSVPEGAPRFVNQLRTWGDARAGFDGRHTWNSEDFRLICRIAHDTMPPEFMRVLRFLWAEPGRGRTFEEIRAGAHCDESIHRQLRQWLICEVLVESAGLYRLRNETIESFKITGLMDQPVTEVTNVIQP